MAKLWRGKFLDPRPTHDLVKTADLRILVREICCEQGIKPPSWIAVLGNKNRRPNAMTVRFGGLGSGFLVITPGLFEDLDDEERRFIIRHELVHYRRGESRWAPLQGFAFLSPVLVCVFSMSIAGVVGEVATVVLYFMSLLFHTLAFGSKRFFERRADRESIRSPYEAAVARRTLVKVSTVRKRHSTGLDLAQQKQVMDEFERQAQEPPNLSLRVFNRIWGTHPLIQDRLAMFATLEKQGSSNSGIIER